MRPTVDTIIAPPFPPQLPWVDGAQGHIDQQAGQPVLLEFWDFCRVNSLRTLPYMREFHRRYELKGLRVIGVHASGFEASSTEQSVRAACARLGIEYPVAIDLDLIVWDLYENAGWPARYLWDHKGVLVDFHYGEGDYAETELAIQSLLGVEQEPMAMLTPADEPGSLIVAQSEDVAGPYSGPYEAGGVWAVLDGEGVVRVAGREISVTHPGCYALIEHPVHTAGTLELEIGDGVVCEAVCFTPGLAQ